MEKEANQLYRRPQMTGQAKDEDGLFHINPRRDHIEGSIPAGAKRVFSDLLTACGSGVTLRMNINPSLTW